jgi:hypothetical protein
MLYVIRTASRVSRRDAEFVSTSYEVRKEWTGTQFSSLFHNVSGTFTIYQQVEVTHSVVQKTGYKITDGVSSLGFTQLKKRFEEQ